MKLLPLLLPLLPLASSSPTYSLTSETVDDDLCHGEKPAVSRAGYFSVEVGNAAIQCCMRLLLCAFSAL